MGPVTRHAPGKLFIAGEYAVMEPGHPAVLIAVDRGVRVTVSASRGAEVEIDSDLVPGRVRLRRRGGWLEPADGEQRSSSLPHAVSAIDVVDALAVEHGLDAPAITVSIRSGLHLDGTKFGLGSSGAVTVAAVDAVTAYYGIAVSPETRFRLALLATARLGTGASGGDLAASVWGGWLAYTAPDRAAVADLAQRRGVRETVDVPWPGFQVRRLPAPDRLALEVGWTGQPASSTSLTRRLEPWRGGSAHRNFLKRSDKCVDAAIDALEQGDDGLLLRQITEARQVLADLDDEAGLGVFTPRLTALCDAAEALGGAAKPCGAGGGDCGIALLEAGEVARLREKWTKAGVAPLPIGVQPAKGARHDL